MSTMTIFVIAGAAAAGLIVGLNFGAAIGGGARAEQDFQDYIHKNDSEI